MGKIDQRIYPYFSLDFTQGKITLEKVQELRDCFLLKTNEIVKVWKIKATQVHVGFSTIQNIIIRG